ncbi:MAG: M23 family metallopeptidase [Henriciella sp.]|nr:M23 family metallopeptidase [Henriciella sp.]
MTTALPGHGLAENAETVAAPPLAYVDCSGIAKQGGLLLCTGLPGSVLNVSPSDGKQARSVTIGENGHVAIGIRQHEGDALTIALQDTSLSLTASIEPREDPYRVIEGFDCDKVDARTQAQKDHAGRSWVKKQAAFKRFETGPGATTGFILPAEGPPSSPFGPTRKYIGVGKDGEPCEKTSIHRGFDLAVPVGTEIVAPADGIVTLGDEDLYYEGGTVFLDHGDGLVSVFMHMSVVDVEVGQNVRVGERLGASGNTGRTTGPHLHWAVKWRNPSSEDRRGDFYIDPALLLELEPQLR